MATITVLTLYFVFKFYNFLFVRLKAFFMTEKGQKIANKLAIPFGSIGLSLLTNVIDKACEADFGYSLAAKTFAGLIFMYLAALLNKNKE